MKEQYIDEYGFDSLPKLRDARKFGMDVFLTNNKSLLEDRKELETRFGLRIRTPEEMNDEFIEEFKKKKLHFKCKKCGHLIWLQNREVHELPDIDCPSCGEEGCENWIVERRREVK